MQHITSVLVILVQCCYLTVVQSQGVPLDQFYRDDIDPIFNNNNVVNPDNGCNMGVSRQLPSVVPFITNIIDVPEKNTNSFEVTLVIVFNIWCNHAFDIPIGL